ncbi:DUF456 domain-containing protein [Halococcus thailandensis]|uniref:DUF456 domain-containing protein n=1 Tax=Halococcus thailandensis JCM 13552 TaxID=1227457 RepID=M0MXF7_9EURY|nr:DUF456 domain-containing protein [Halococcus thailandensis]EMA50291.1 hypothetical protein C451_17370 [Halococcus thailandensis JCM 13552]
MVDIAVLAAVGLGVLGVVGSVVPLVPGTLSSLVGVYLYWWASGYTEPGPLLLAALTVVGVLALVADYFGGAVSARAGGASMVTTTLAAIVGIALFFVVGPLGIVLGVAGTVFVVEFYRHRNPERSLRAALYAAVGVLASTVVQLLVTVTMLVALVAVILL